METKLLLLTDHPFPKLILLSCTFSKDDVPTLQEDSWKDLHEVGAQVSEDLTDVIVNHDSSVVISVCYARRLRITLLDNREFGESHDVLFVVPSPLHSDPAFAYRSVPPTESLNPGYFPSLLSIVQRARTPSPLRFSTLIMKTDHTSHRKT